MISKTLRPMTPVLASALALVLAAGSVQAQAPAPEGKPAPFMKLDTDNDGSISRAEWDAPRLAKLKALDPNEDGVITLEEMKAEAVARAVARAEASAERRFKMLDVDGDGKVSAAEVLLGAERAPQPGPKGKGPHPQPPHAQGPQHGPKADPARLFDHIDADKDGVLSPAELEAVHKPQGPKGGPRGEHPHPGKGPKPGQPAVE